MWCVQTTFTNECLVISALETYYQGHQAYKLPVRTVGVPHLSNASVLSQQSHLSVSNPYRNQAADQQPKNYMSDGQEEKEGYRERYEDKSSCENEKN